MSKTTRLRIAALMLAAFLIGSNFTGALLLVPPIEDAFGADITATQWVLNIHALTFGMFMVAGGRLGDLYGRRRVLLIGLAVFATGAFGCFAAPSIGWLIGARAVQGLGDAIMWTCALALGTNLAKPDERGLAVGLLLAGLTGGDLCGPLISGVIVSLSDWRMFFVVSLVLALLAAVFVLRVVPKDMPGEGDDRVDTVGMVVLSAAVLALLYGLDVGSDWGWGSPALLGLFGLSLALFVAFPFVEQRVANPMVPPAMLSNRQFILALLTNGLMVPALFISFLYFPQFMQNGLGWTVLQSSFGILPLMVLSVLGSLASGRFYEANGPKRLLSVGYSLAAAGSAWTIWFVSLSEYLAIVPGLMMIGFGTALAVGAASTLAVSSVGPTRTGLAGGLSFMFHLTLGAIGVAVATAIMYGAEGADLDVEDFALAFWPALAAALLGLAVVWAVDERRLRRVDEHVSGR